MLATAAASITPHAKGRKQASDFGCLEMKVSYRKSCGNFPLIHMAPKAASKIRPRIRGACIWTFLRAGLFTGIITAGISGGILFAGWFNPLPISLIVIAGCAISIASAWGIRSWLEWRSIPKEILEKRIQEPLLKIAMTLSIPMDLPLMAGEQSWNPLDNGWPEIRKHGFPLPAGELAGLIAPLQMGEGSGLLDRAVWQEVPAPPPSQPLLEAGFKIGQSVATGEMVGVDPDGHGLATGGSRSGKSSFVYSMLEQLIARGDDAPGIFLVDPHVSLADAFLDAIAQLPQEQRQKAVKRLRVITPDQPQVIPLNLLAVPEFTWAGNAIVQIGRRIWDDYWGPRMQAALLGLCSHRACLESKSSGGRAWTFACRLHGFQ